MSGCASQYYSQDTNQAGVPTADLPPAAYCTFTTSNVTGTATYRISVELSAPTAAAIPARPPDANGWYDHPVAVSFQGSAFSGIASCTPAQTYAGPDTLGVALGGSCTDNAGKTASASVNLAYDATPPALGVSTDSGDGSVALHWQAASSPAPLVSLQVARSPGLGAAEASVLYQGNSGVFQDTRVRNRVRYQYTITAQDQAGNVTTRTVTVTPGPRLLAPAGGVHISAPPLLRWTPVPKASYYNLQLYRGDKILSVWPKRARLQLSRAWRFDGRRHRLKPGRYRWYVWPGFGKRAAARYGAIVGTATFVVT